MTGQVSPVRMVSSRKGLYDVLRTSVRPILGKMKDASGLFPEEVYYVLTPETMRIPKFRILQLLQSWFMRCDCPGAYILGMECY